MSASLFKIGAGRRAKTKLSDEAAAADAGDGKKKKTAAMSMRGRSHVPGSDSSD